MEGAWTCSIRAELYTSHLRPHSCNDNHYFISMLTLELTLYPGGTWEALENMQVTTEENKTKIVLFLAKKNVFPHWILLKNKQLEYVLLLSLGPNQNFRTKTIGSDLTLQFKFSQRKTNSEYSNGITTGSVKSDEKNKLVAHM